jgi:DNA-binding NtrC family response regulator
MNASFLSESSELLDQVDVQVLLEVLSASNDACWCMEFGQPVDLTAPDHEVVRQVFENNPRWRLSNNAMAELYLLAAGENFNERPVREIFPRNMQNEEFVLALIANGFEVDRAPALDKRYDGQEIYVENDVRAHIKNGQLIRMFGIVRDVGKHRQKQVFLETQIAGLEATLNAMVVPVIAVSDDLGVRLANHAARNRTRPDFKAQRRLSPVLNKVLSRGERAIQQGARILITGETGVGKTEIARHLHGSVTNANDPFVVVNCAISDPAEIVAQLFGDDDGSLGYFEQAAGGTLFLDEIAELPMSAQIRLLGYLENNETGTSHQNINENARVNLISATNLDLRKLSSEGKFRSDLYYRLAIMDLKVPPLRQMPALIDHLSHRFMGTLNQRRTSSMILSKRLRGALQDYSFPGNIRELLNLIQKAAILMEDAEDMDELIGELIEPVSIEAGSENFAIGSSDLKAEVKRFEREIIDRAIKLHGSKRKAATALGVDIGTISRKTSNSNEHNEDGMNPPHKQTSTWS